MRKAVYEVEKATGRIVRTFRSMADACGSFGCSIDSAIHQCRDKVLPPGGTCLRYADGFDDNEIFATRRNRPVAVLTDGELAYVAESAADAARWIPCDAATVRRNARDGSVFLGRYEARTLERMGQYE